MNLTDQSGASISATQVTAYVTPSNSAKTDDGRVRLTFKITKNNSYTINSDEHAGNTCYLLPNQYLTILITAQTNGYENTEDRAENVAGMAVYDYCGYTDISGDAVLKLDDSVSITPTYKKGVISANDGTGSLVSSAEAAANLNMDISGTSGADWLTSSVTVERGQIVPGIQKTAKSSWYGTGENDNPEWTVKVTNNGAEAIRGYVITDVMMYPYVFTGNISYTLYNAADSSISSISLNLTAGTTTTYMGKVTVGLSTDEDKNQVLTLYFQDTTKAAIPAGGYGVLSLTTKNSTNNVVSSQNYINKAYLTPTTQSYQATGQGTPLSSYDVTIGNETVSKPTITSQAMITVSSGYATTAVKTVTELNVTNTETGVTYESTKNTASSDGDTNFIVLENDAQSVFCYDLKVSNSGNSSNGGSSADAIETFVLIDNLPEENDHTTFYKSVDRYSDFQVNFYEDDLNFKVYTITDNVTTVLSEDDYTLLFSKETNLDYDKNKDLWEGKPAPDGWYTLEQIKESETLKLSDMRSFRVVINNKDLTPAGVEIHIAFNATVSGDPTYSDIAWNSYGYWYQVDGTALRSAPSMVGVKIRGTVYLNKSLVGPDLEAYKAEKDEEFQYIIYQGKDKELTPSTDVNDLARQLYDKGETEFLIVTAPVEKGQSTSGNIELENYKVWTYDEATGKAIEETDKNWTWTDNIQYTVMEVLPEESGDYDFYSLNGSSYNSSTFTYVRSSSNTIQSVNQRISWELDILKQDRQTNDLLSGAVFALYTKNPDLKTTMTDAEATELGLTSPAAERQVIDDTTWYLMKWGTTNTSGILKWTGLMEPEYYYQEIKPPTGYEMNVDQGAVVETTDNRRGSKSVTVLNDLVVVLAKTGGIGTQWYRLGGIALLLAGGVGCCLKLKRKGRRRT
jgi:LPXTG-motif cell wall-anchored protein